MTLHPIRGSPVSLSVIFPTSFPVVPERANELRTIKDILLVFELEVDKEKNGERVIIYDKKN